MLGHLVIFFGAHFGFGQCLINVRIVEQAKVEFELQHMAHGTVNVFFADEASLQGLFQETTIVVTTQVNIDTCFQGQGSGLRRVGGHMLCGINRVDGIQIRKDHAIEIP